MEGVQDNQLLADAAPAASWCMRAHEGRHTGDGVCRDCGSSSSSTAAVHWLKQAQHAPLPKSPTGRLRQPISLQWATNPT